MEYSSHPDEILVNHLVASDEEAFKIIYLRYWKKLFYMAYKRLGSKEEAEECIQNVFTSLWEKRETLKVDSLENYLVTAVRYKVINYVSESILHRSKLKQITFLSKEATELNSHDMLDLNKAIEQALSLLPDKTREIFKLSRFEHFPVKKIAEQMNLTEKAVEYHITQSIKLMRKQLKEFMVFDTVIIMMCFIQGS